MKKLYFIITFLFFCTVIYAQVGINTDNSSPDASAMLDVKSTTLGVLICRVALTATNNPSPVTSPAAGLLIYNTASSGVSPYIVCPGLYMWTGVAWTRLDNGQSCDPTPLPDNCNPPGGLVTDIEGHVYATVTIGYQQWMAQNLQVVHYNNGDAIPDVTGNSAWAALTTGAYCWYGNNGANKSIYGALYNWYVVHDSRNLCPTGWKVPGDADWTTLETYLNMSVAGGKMKATGTTNWFAPNTGANNATCFSGLGGGYRFDDGTFNYITYYGIFWSSAENSSMDAKALRLHFDQTYADRPVWDKEYGFSVRCLKDDPCQGSYSPVSVSISASANPVSAGTSVTYTAIPVNGGTIPVYLWKVNGVTVSSGSSATYTYLPVNNDAVTCILTSNASCITGNPATSNTITMVVFTCGSSITINHLVSGGVAPVNKAVTYGTVTNIPGETTKCWITSNLGADHQATAVNDASETSAGWYWQFNRKQGYSNDGTNTIPIVVWPTVIQENTDWQTVNDPCLLELGNGWRIPTKTEWQNVDAIGGWTSWTGPWNSALKIHAAGDIWGGDLELRGIGGEYWSNVQFNSVNGRILTIDNSQCELGSGSKIYGASIRCIK